MGAVDDEARKRIGKLEKRVDGLRETLQHYYDALHDALADNKDLRERLQGAREALKGFSNLAPRSIDHALAEIDGDSETLVREAAEHDQYAAEQRDEISRLNKHINKLDAELARKS